MIAMEDPIDKLASHALREYATIVAALVDAAVASGLPEAMVREAVEREKAAFRRPPRWRDSHASASPTDA